MSLGGVLETLFASPPRSVVQSLSHVPSTVRPLVPWLPCCSANGKHPSAGDGREEEKDIKIFVPQLPSLKVTRGYRVTPYNTGSVRQPSPHRGPSFPVFQELLPPLVPSQPTLPAIGLLVFLVSLHPAHPSCNCPIEVCVCFLPVPGLNIIIP